MAVLSTRGPTRQKQPDGQTSKFHQQIAFSLLSRTISLSAAGHGRFINARPNGRFIKGEATGWPDLQISATNCSKPNSRFINARPNGRFIKQKQPDGQTSRFQRQIAFSLLSRTISLSAAGPSYSQQKQAQWPFYQREAQWPFIKYSIFPRNQFISGRAKPFSAEASPMAVLSRPVP